MQTIGYKSKRELIWQRIFYNAFAMFNMYESIPNSDCYLVGYKSVVPVRLLLDWSIERSEFTAMMLAEEATNETEEEESAFENPPTIDGP